MRASKIFMLALLAMLILAFVGTVLAQDAAQPIAVKEFWQLFENDRQKAEAEYIGKTMTFTGVVVETGMSIYLTPTARLSDAADGRQYMICVLPRADAGKMSGFKKGERVTMTGRVYSSKPDGGVVVKECRQAD